MSRSTPIDYRKNPYTKTGGLDPEKYRAMRRRSAEACSKEAAHVTGQGCADIYENGYPLRGCHE